ncbi:DUF2207 domain-containing protein [Spongiactinospora sp. TRM90649]|uniref:DUF2207 domain-containing protein n=1 Tax=Spongiactinospora sp. TRM90649 TaxID=3031114 RepID=UPI0023FA36CC|nr:DUF2207 domain-containing protein [Spongiactinospora sp. TRM90649]MDF5751731.1 DUF2207 domain-containing protein [Spongiactinospora sp. TRM90649]
MAGSTSRRTAVRVTTGMAVATALCTTFLSAFSAASPTAHAATGAADGVRAGVVKIDAVELSLRPGGALHVKETVTYEGGAPTRKLVTRTRYDDSSDRLYKVENLKGNAAIAGDTITVTGGASGTATFEYDVKGVITPLGDGEEMRWYAAGGWSAPVEQATVKVTGSAQIQNLSCFAGALTSALPCTAASMDHTGATGDFEQQGLAGGETLTIVMGYPKGTSGGGPILERRFELSNAFTVNAVTGGALAGLLLVLLGGIGLLYWTRGRDARVVGHESGALNPMRDGHFTPPDGVRPGQIGTLLDEQADVIDVTATIVDLAVRGYVRIDEQPRQTYDAPDWTLVKLPDAPVSALLPYERALYDAIFADRDSVLLSELRGSFAKDLGRVRDALYTDVVRQGWFARRPDGVRTRWTLVGGALTVAGVLATVALAWFSAYGLLGLAVIIAGAALAVGGQYMPAKTAKGAAALAHTLGFREYLAEGDLDQVPPDKRVEVFSRYLPYAVVFDNVDRWARVVASVNGNGRPADNLYWYHGPAEWDLSKFAGSMRTFATTTSGAISASRQFRSL